MLPTLVPLLLIFHPCTASSVRGLQATWSADQDTETGEKYAVIFNTYNFSDLFLCIAPQIVLWYNWKGMCGGGEGQKWAAESGDRTGIHQSGAHVGWNDPGNRFSPLSLFVSAALLSYSNQWSEKVPLDRAHEFPNNIEFAFVLQLRKKNKQTKQTKNKQTKHNCLTIL